MASVADFKKRFPEFCDIDDDRAQMFLDDAALLMADPVRWLSYYDVAQLYFAAHLLFSAESSSWGDGSILAPSTKQQVDEVLVESAIANVHPSFDELLSTSYGKRYYGYRRIVFAGIYGV